MSELMEDENDMAALDELLGIIDKDEINVGLGRDSCEGFIKENETLYESAIADQTWMALEESTNNENNHISGLDLALKTPTAEDSVGSPATITDTPTPSAADKRENFCFNVDQAQKVFETSSPDLSLGKEKWVTKRTPNFGFRKEKPSQLSQSCPDFGFCKGNRKEDEVFRSLTEYCDFHVLTAYKKFASKRGELQLNSNRSPNLKKKLSGSSNLTTVKIFPQRPTPKHNVAELLHKVSIVETAKSSGAGETSADGGQSKPDKNQAFVDLLRRPTVGSRNLLKQISQPTFSNASKNGAKPEFSSVSSGRQFLASYKVKNSQADLAKAKAIAIIKSKGEGISSKQEPNNNAVYKRPPIRGDTKMAQVVGDTNFDCQSPLRKRQKLGDLDVGKEKLSAILSKKSKHEHLVDKDDLERQETYFKVMESKEKVENRAAEIMSLQNCKVVSCKTCDYTWHSQSDMCKQFGHKVLWHAAEKRFFKCKHCGKRTISYCKYPTKPCAGCHSTTFERVAMREEKQGPKLFGEELKIRGDEEAFLS